MITLHTDLEIVQYDVASSAVILATVPCGTPFEPVYDQYNSDSVAKFFSPNPSKTYFFRVRGNSMIDVGLTFGDMIAVDTEEKPEIGKIVLALVNNEITCKIWSGYSLLPANEAHEPIIFREGDEMKIWGVVTSFARQL
jgi:DNA polymerase V